MSLSYEERKKTILDLLAKEEKVKVPALAEQLNVSGETIRRDLERLDKEKKLKKVYGGAVKTGSDSWEPPFELKASMNAAEKRAVGKLAASLVEDGDSIMLGNGTTTMEIIRFIGGKKNVTLVTHSTPAMLLAMELFEGRIIFIGGEVNVDQKSANGPLAEWMLEHLKVNKTFISAGGVSAVDGITDYDLQEANISKKMMERADDVIVLADYTKMGKTTFARIGELKDISVIISNNRCPDEWKRILAEKNIELLLADEEDTF
ncbi:DeoR faimly transcriptional regulator [Paenibacillus darwinianus]|uniref:DeoR faimly transcriptional regulator n=1 Tax=Paenibacillus darwinianus TaxID=1380763 RepID=A0A9W5RYL1_9BACL|nr:DeoR/GlpR family DNA-binding transcription regulator [Paenibacillus darwinianus]EXX84960.1 DeoR faimly transcriptional regulator [Paenibacillus darwinianus]EXX84993.1 DeoR faimly transcriptional regulator [Paenibacillus darwinianus]